MLQLLRRVLMLVTVLALCVGAVRMGYGLAFPMEEAGVFAMSGCELPCWMGLEVNPSGFLYERCPIELALQLGFPDLILYGDPDLTFYYYPENVSFRISHRDLYSSAWVEFQSREYMEEFIQRYRSSDYAFSTIHNTYVEYALEECLLNTAISEPIS